VKEKSDRTAEMLLVLPFGAHDPEICHG